MIEDRGPTAASRFPATGSGRQLPARKCLSPRSGWIPALRSGRGSPLASGAWSATGLIDEVGGLAPRLGPTAAAAVGYRQLLPVVAGERSVEDGHTLTEQATIGLAKRQRTFFRRDPRIRWVDWSDDPDEVYQAVRHA